MVVWPTEGLFGLAVELNAVHDVDAPRVQGLTEGDGDLFVGSRLQALISSQGKLEPPPLGNGGGVSRDAEGPAQHLDVAGDPSDILAPQKDPDAHHHLVGVVAGHLQLESGDLGVGDVERDRSQPVFELLNVVDLKDVVASVLQAVVGDLVRVNNSTLFFIISW